MLLSTGAAGEMCSGEEGRECCLRHDCGDIITLVTTFQSAFQPFYPGKATRNWRDLAVRPAEHYQYDFAARISDLWTGLERR